MAQEPTKAGPRLLCVAESPCKGPKCCLADSFWFLPSVFRLCLVSLLRVLAFTLCENYVNVCQKPNNNPQKQTTHPSEILQPYMDIEALGRGPGDHFVSKTGQNLNSIAKVIWRTPAEPNERQKKPRSTFCSAWDVFFRDTFAHRFHVIPGPEFYVLLQCSTGFKCCK